MIFSRYSKFPRITKWLLRAYLLWSICADIIVLSGIIYLLFR